MEFPVVLVEEWVVVVVWGVVVLSAAAAAVLAGEMVVVVDVSVKLWLPVVAGVQLVVQCLLEESLLRSHIGGRILHLREQHHDNQDIF